MQRRRKSRSDPNKVGPSDAIACTPQCLRCPPDLARYQEIINGVVDSGYARPMAAVAYDQLWQLGFDFDGKSVDECVEGIVKYLKDVS